MSRKYRHRGYQDNDWDEDRNWRKGRNDRNQGGGFLDDSKQRSARDPRERTGPKPLERDQKDEVFRCHLCGQAIRIDEEIDFEASCPNCDADLRCCKGCVWFDSQARWECRQSDKIAERIKRKDERNRCEMFKPRMVLDTSGRSKADSGFFGGGGDELGRKAFEALFGDD